MRGRDLRHMRRRAGVTQRELRARLGWDSWKLVRIEAEDVLATPEDEVRIIETIRAMEREREERVHHITQEAVA